MTKVPSSILVWFRQDLRISDNPALYDAAKKGTTIIPIYILEEETSEIFKIGSASCCWLYYSLAKLNHDLRHQLNFYQGSAEKIIFNLLEKYPIHAVYWNRCYEPERVQYDADLKAAIQKQGIACKSFNASLLWEPWEVVKDDASPYKVFTPFYRKVLSKTETLRTPFPKPEKMDLYHDPFSKKLEELQLLPSFRWDKKMELHDQAGEKLAEKKLNYFLENQLEEYQEKRDYPFPSHTSNLSPHLHFGEISPHQIWHKTQEKAVNHLKKAGDAFLRQLVWREFSYNLLFHFPEIPWKNFNKNFDSFPWKTKSNLLIRWQQGQTGYPLIDAGMRELWKTGIMHNRVRMVVASFLVKNLLIDWRIGAAWFWDCLVDADLANNSSSWQWVAGCGVDAAPYFRIFNPTLQAKKFDPEGTYICRFIPELAKLPKKFLFEPWKASKSILEEAGISLGKTYPFPIVSLESSRDKALEAYHETSKLKSFLK